MASKLYGVNATIIIFVFVLYCITFPAPDWIVVVKNMMKVAFVASD